MGRRERRASTPADRTDMQIRLAKPATLGDIVKVMRDHNWRHHTPWWRKLWLRFKAAR